MRKKTINLLSEKSMWLFIYLLPLVITCIVLIHHSPDELLQFITSNQFGAIESTFIYSALSDLFGTNGIMPMFVGDFKYFMYYGTYFVYITILHLVLDFLVFIPRIAEKFADKFYQED